MGSRLDPTGAVLVTGGSGFIGSRVVANLVNRGLDVVVPVHASHPSRPLEGARLVESDLTDRTAAVTMMEGVSLVIHLAAMSGGIELQEGTNVDVMAANAAITSSVLRAAADSGAKRVFLASSAVVYRQGPSKPLQEEDPIVAPLDRPSGYAWSKVTDELMGRWASGEWGLEVVVGRLSSVYGPDLFGNRRTVVDDLIRRAVDATDELVVWGDGTAVRSFNYVEDAAAAIVAIATLGSPGHAYNIDSGVEVTIAELAALIVHAVNPSLTLRFDPDKPTGPAYRVLDPAKLRDLGFAAEFSLEDGLAATVASIVGSIS